VTEQKFIVEPHFRLQEWVAEEKGYFKAEGLDYIFRELIQSTDGAHHDKGDKVGAFQSFERGREADVSCACHWTVGVAASKGKGRLYADVYSVAPSGVFVPADSPIKSPEDLAGVPISVGYQSGSHYSTIQALEPYLPPDQINLSFADGMLFKRMEMLIEHRAPASALFSGPYYFAEQLGFRKIIDTTFMIATMVTGNPVASSSTRCGARSAISICDRISIPTTTRTSSRCATTRRWTRAAGGLASGWCSNLIPGRSTRRPSNGSPIMAFSPIVTWVRATTRKPS
jgi:hypothetical protein